MAKRTDFVKGMTIEQILNMPWNELRDLTDSELRVLVGRGVSSANKRIRRYEAKKGKLPTAGKQGTKYSDVAFSTVGKDRKELFEEFKRIKYFMSAETSSLSGVREVEKKSIQALKKKAKKTGLDIDISNVNYDRFWEAYDKLKELNPHIDEMNFKYEVIEMIKQNVSGKKWFKVDNLVMKLDKQINQIYEANQAIKGQTANGVSDFFEV